LFLLDTYFYGLSYAPLIMLEAEDKNKQLEETLSHAEEKIRQLEIEILSLKNQKQSKNIKDYFGKNVLFPYAT